MGRSSDGVPKCFRDLDPPVFVDIDVLAVEFLAAHCEGAFRGREFGTCGWVVEEDEGSDEGAAARYYAFD
jgi:hypothetical protein